LKHQGFEEHPFDRHFPQVRRQNRPPADMKKKSRIEIERKIVSRVKREMDKPRLAESVRNDFRTLAAPAIERAAARSGRA
jgi:hypothetical protein